MVNDRMGIAYLVFAVRSTVCHCCTIILYANRHRIVCEENAWSNTEHIIHILLSPHVDIAYNIVAASEVLRVACKPAPCEETGLQTLLVCNVEPAADAP